MTMTWRGPAAESRLGSLAATASVWAIGVQLPELGGAESRAPRMAVRFDIAGATSTPPGPHWSGRGNVIRPNSAFASYVLRTWPSPETAMSHLVWAPMLPVTIELDLSRTTITREGSQVSAAAI